MERAPSIVIAGRQRLAVLGAALGASLFFAGTLVAPLAGAGGHAWAHGLRLAYAPLCHQLPQRCLWIGAHAQAVCARCAGLYLGAALGLFVAVWAVAGRPRRMRPAALALAVLPSAADFGLGVLGLPQLPAVPRLLVAMPPGFVVGLFLAAAISELSAPAGASPRRPWMPLGPTEKAHG